MAYGSMLGVAAFTPRFANAAGRFDDTTTPTAAQVDEWRVQVSAMLDVAMSGVGLPSPATEATVTAMLDGFTNGNVAWLVESVNGQGRYQERPATTREIMAAIASTVVTWVTGNAAAIGAASGLGAESGIAAGTGSVLPTRQDEYTRYATTTEYSRDWL